MGSGNSLILSACHVASRHPIPVATVCFFGPSSVGDKKCLCGSRQSDEASLRSAIARLWKNYPSAWLYEPLRLEAYRAAGMADRNFQVLAEGTIAKELYYEIQTMVRNHRETLRRDFNDSVERLIININEQVRGTAAEDWKSVDGAEQGYTGYRADVNGMTVTVSSIVRDRTAAYAMNFVKYGLRWDCRDSTLCKEIFDLVDESARNASLEQLGKVLDDML